ncbi:TetR family transcriptional regulator [Microvirga tunisiensis]|uniref:TetR family transcriptional regulator n=1 Tax=Pannonibacter tanglangensis TaxID=2750084 RepID=A0A7X5F400_9HYPH|nr:TetR/AcrR family transcriptional regulator [Pannonibacter sp. XCT-53]NBN79318.1 TetR family transcriptional regulator [Pannonibacter sp. XCT-53]
MPKPKGRNADMRAATREALMTAARTLFEQNGYEAVSTQAICAAAGVSQGTLFAHFGSKRDLFIAVHDAWQDHLVASIDAAARRHVDPWLRFDAIWRAYLAATDIPPMRQILLLDGPHVIGLAQMRARDRETAFAFLKAEVTGLIDAQLLRPVDPHGLAVLLFGALDQAAFEIADFPADTDLRLRLVASVEALLDALRPA